MAAAYQLGLEAERDVDLHAEVNVGNVFVLRGTLVCHDKSTMARSPKTSCHYV